MRLRTTLRRRKLLIGVVTLVVVAMSGGAYIAYAWHQSTVTAQIRFPRSGLVLTYPTAAWSLEGKVLSSVSRLCGDQEYGTLKYRHSSLDLEVSVGSCTPGRGEEGPCATTGPFACTTEFRNVATIQLSPTATKYVLAQRYTLFGVTVYRLLVSDSASCDELNCPLTINGAKYAQSAITVGFIGDQTPTFTSLDGFVQDSRVAAGLQVLRTSHYE